MHASALSRAKTLRLSSLVMQATPSAASTTRVRPRCMPHTPIQPPRQPRRWRPRSRDVSAVSKRYSFKAWLGFRRRARARRGFGAPRPLYDLDRAPRATPSWARSRTPCGRRAGGRLLPGGALACDFDRNAGPALATASCGARSPHGARHLDRGDRRPSRTTTTPTASSTSSSSTRSCATSTASSAAGPAAARWATMRAGRRARLAPVRAAFARFDRNRSGFLDYRELRNALTHMGLDLLDEHGDRARARTTTIRTASSTSSSLATSSATSAPCRRRPAPRRHAAAAPRCHAAAPGRAVGQVRSAFDHFDKNRSGYLDYRELRNALRRMGFDVSTRTAIDVLRAYDDHPDGKLDVHEFDNLVRDLNGARPTAAVNAAWRPPKSAWRGTSRRLGRCRRRLIRAGCRARSKGARLERGAGRGVAPARRSLRRRRRLPRGVDRREGAPRARAGDDALDAAHPRRGHAGGSARRSSRSRSSGASTASRTGCRRRRRARAPTARSSRGATAATAGPSCTITLGPSTLTS